MYRYANTQTCVGVMHYSIRRETTASRLLSGFPQYTRDQLFRASRRLSCPCFSFHSTPFPSVPTLFYTSQIQTLKHALIASYPQSSNVNYSSTPIYLHSLSGSFFNKQTNKIKPKIYIYIYIIKE